MRATTVSFEKASDEEGLQVSRLSSVFLKRGGRIYIVVIEGAKVQSLMGKIRDRIQPDRIVYTDSFYSYDTLAILLKSNNLSEYCIIYTPLYIFPRNSYVAF